MTGHHSIAYSQREHNEFMAEQEREEERAYLRAGMPSPFRPGVVRPIQYPESVLRRWAAERMQRQGTGGGQ